MHRNARFDKKWFIGMRKGKVTSLNSANL